MSIGDPFYVNSDDVEYLLGIVRDGLSRPSGQDPTIGAIRRLADLGDRTAISLFHQALNHSNVTVKVDAALALHRLNEEAGLKALIFFASEDKSSINAIRAMAKTNDPRARDFLLQLKTSSGSKLQMFNGDMMPLGKIIDEVLGVEVSNGNRLYIYKNNQQYGPYDESAVLEWLRNGQCALSDLAIQERMNDWQPLGMMFPVPITTSADLAMEMELFDSRAEELQDLYNQAEQAGKHRSRQLMEKHRQKLQVLERQVYSLKHQFPNSDDVAIMECFLYVRCSGLPMADDNWNGALHFLHRSISVIDTPNARLIRASVYLKLNRQDLALQDLNHILVNPVEDEELYFAARQMKDDL